MSCKLFVKLTFTPLLTIVTIASHNCISVRKASQYRRTWTNIQQFSHLLAILIHDIMWWDLNICPRNCIEAHRRYHFPGHAPRITFLVPCGYHHQEEAQTHTLINYLSIFIAFGALPFQNHPKDPQVQKYSPLSQNILINATRFREISLTILNSVT